MKDKKRIGELNVLIFSTFLMVLTFSLKAQNLPETGSPNLLIDDDRLDKVHWLYFGWEEDHPKPISLMGGAVYPRRPRLINQEGVWCDIYWKYSKKPWHINSSGIVLFLLSVDGSAPFYPNEKNPFRRKTIQWSIVDNYLPFPVSKWEKDNVEVQIMHLGKRILNNSVNVVYTQVKLTNKDNVTHQAQVIVNGDEVTERVFPLGKFSMTKAGAHQMNVSASLPAGKSVTYEFVLPANGQADIKDIIKEGGFTKQYADTKAEINRKMNQLTQPVSMPYDELIYAWKSSMPNMWNATVKTPTDLEQRDSGGNVNGFNPYDRPFDHNIPDMVIQYVIEGNWDLARKIMEGSALENLSKGKLALEKYNDAIPKYMVTLAQYLQVTGDKEYFTDKVFDKVKSCAHAVHGMREGQLNDTLTEKRAYGLIEKGGTLDNGSEYLIVDNFAALHGYAAYMYICNRLGKVDESKWIKTEMADLNNCLNKALEFSMKDKNINWYNACFSFDYDSVLVSGPGNWLGTSFLMSTFPWNAYLKGFDQEGTWKDSFDSSIEKWLDECKKYGCKDGSFGAWWSVKYGSAYNAGMGMPLLYSDKYRTLTTQAIEWMLDNQSAPYQWGESFSEAHPASDWTLPAVDYAAWGLGFMRQAILQVCVSVHVDGTIILGRGIPDHWLNSGRAIAWKNVFINNGKKIDFSIRKDGSKVYIQITGDNADGNIVVDLPAMNGNKVIKQGNTKEIVIELNK